MESNRRSSVIWDCAIEGDSGTLVLPRVSFRLLDYVKVSDCHPTIVQYRSLKATGQSNGETPEPKETLLPSKLVFSGILSQQQALAKADVLSPECQLLGSRGEAPSSALSLGRYVAHVRRSIFFLFKLSEDLTT